MSDNLVFLSKEWFATPIKATVPARVPITGPFEEEGHVINYNTFTDVIGTTFSINIVSANKDSYFGGLTPINDPYAYKHRNCVWTSTTDHYYIKDRSNPNDKMRIFSVPKDMVTNVIWGVKPIL